MNENIKRALKTISAILLGIITVLSIYELIKKVKDKDALPIIKAMQLLDESGSEIIDVLGNGTKFLVYDNAESHRHFESYLAEKGYQYVGRFGKSKLYDFADYEVIVKRIKMFNRYVLYEIYNETYFGESSY